jgi:uncharacterized OB-fold protein
MNSLPAAPVEAAFLVAEHGPLDVWRSALNGGRLTLQRCQACLCHVFYPRVVCPHCSHEALDWVESPGQGTVYSVTVVARKAEQGGSYNVVLVDLDEGVRLMSRVDGVPPDEVRIGLRVRHAIVREGSEAMLVFRPDPA